MMNQRTAVVVEDDGGGMEIQAATRGTGLGRRLVRAMTESLGGTVEIEPGSPGTRIEVRFPLV